MSKTVSAGSLEHQAHQIVQTLGGVWTKSGGMCRCPAHDDRNPSLSVTVGARAVLFHCFAGCSSRDVIEALQRKGIRLRALFDGSAEPLPVTMRDAVPNSNARRIWREAQALAGSPASSYLAARNIRILSPALRFHPRTPLGPKENVRFLPALVAAVRNDEGILALHRTFLDPDLPKLAEFEMPKRALGQPGRGAVRLSPPRCGKLGLAEGVETGLSAMQLFDIPTWATLGNERFGLVAVPESVRELHLFVDHDAGGSLAAARAQAAHMRPGRRILVRCPPGQGDDWNDVLRSR